MQIKILGTRGKIKPTSPYHSKHSGILIDKKFLFDLGEKEFLKYNPQIIFITHLHPDHAFFVLEKNKNLNIKIPIFAPEKYKNNAEINIMKKGQLFNSYMITPIPTHHSLKVKSQAYLIEKNKQKILYTGDLIWIDKKFHKKLSNLNLVITEASFLKKGGRINRDPKSGQIYGHNGINELIQLFKQFTNKIALVHFGSWFYKNIKESKKKLQYLAKKNNINLTIGYDGKEFHV